MTKHQSVLFNIKIHKEALRGSMTEEVCCSGETILLRDAKYETCSEIYELEQYPKQQTGSWLSWVGRFAFSFFALTISYFVTNSK